MKNWIAIALLTLLGSAYAQSPLQDPRGARINLDAHASEEVDNDAAWRSELFGFSGEACQSRACSKPPYPLTVATSRHRDRWS